jgi:hypothetical protein
MDRSKSTESNARSKIVGAARTGRREFLSRATKGVALAAVAVGLGGAKEAGAAGCDCYGSWQTYYCELEWCDSERARRNGWARQKRVRYTPNVVTGCGPDMTYCTTDYRRVYGAGCYVNNCTYV